jgi:hypothetical protein
MSVCGSKEGLTKAVQELVTKIAEAPEKKPMIDAYGNAVSSNRAPNGNFQVRILIPKIASGVLIGRQGTVIKQMSEVSNCKIQLGDEIDPYETKERIVIVSAAAVQSLVSVRYNLLYQLSLD